MTLQQLNAFVHSWARKTSLAGALVLFLTAGPTWFSACAQQTGSVSYSGPITITSGGTYSGNWQSNDSNTPAVTISTSQPVIIENSNIRSASILIKAHTSGSDVVVRNTNGYATTPTLDNRRMGRFLDANNFKNIRIEHCYMEQTSGIYMAGYVGDRSVNQTVKVLYNKVFNLDGRTRNGGTEQVQFFQFNGVHGIRGVEVAWNQVINTPNNSFVEDNINLYKSYGTSDSPILIHDNYIQGAYPKVATDPNHSGGGIIMGDGDPSSINDACGFAKCYNNQVIGTTHYGIAVAAGHDIEIYNNRVVSSGYVNGQYLQSSNVGIYTVNGVNNDANTSPTFFNISVHDNAIGYTKIMNSSGWVRNDTWFRNIHTEYNNVALPAPINTQSEQNEFASWQQKLRNNNVTLGPVTGGTTTTPTAPANQAPTISLAAASTSVPLNSPVALTATAADADGTVTKVAFYQGATLLGEDTSAPYQYSWTPSATGSFSLTAKATDNSGATTTSAAVSVQVNPLTITPPVSSGSNTTPITGGTVATGSFYRAINVAGSNSTIDNNNWESSWNASNVTVTGTPFSNHNVALNPSTDAARTQMIRSSVFGRNVGVTVGSVPNGTYSVYLYVWEDNTPSTFSVSVQGQTVQSNYNSGSAGNWAKLGPFTASVTNGTLAVTAAGSGDANLSGVEIWNGAATTSPSTPTTPVANIAPRVSLAAASTTVTANTAVALTATASDADGTVTKVAFYQGATLLGEDTSAPYQYNWTPSTAGSYSLTAVATDNSGATTTSSAVNVQVNAPTTTPVAQKVFYRAINVAGSNATLDNNRWESSWTAPNVSITGTPFSNQNVALTPATDATRSSMIRSSYFGTNVNFRMASVPNGTYDVYMYVWEDNSPATFSLALNGQTVVSNRNSGSAGSWAKVGPFTTTVSNGTINITSSGGDVNLSGVEVYSRSASGNQATTTTTQNATGQ